LIDTNDLAVCARIGTLLVSDNGKSRVIRSLDKLVGMRLSFVLLLELGVVWARLRAPEIARR
jgi:hypothetical protein